MFLIRLGRWFEFELEQVGDGIFLKAPLIGQVWVSWSMGCCWDRP